MITVTDFEFNIPAADSDDTELTSLESSISMLDADFPGQVQFDTFSPVRTLSTRDPNTSDGCVQFDAYPHGAKTVSDHSQINAVIIEALLPVS